MQSLPADVQPPGAASDGGVCADVVEDGDDGAGRKVTAAPLVLVGDRRHGAAIDVAGDTAVERDAQRPAVRLVHEDHLASSVPFSEMASAMGRHTNVGPLESGARPVPPP